MRHHWIISSFVALTTCGVIFLYWYLPTAADTQIVYVGEWGNVVSAGSFVEPTGITVDSSENVYLIDSSNTNAYIKKYSSAYGYLTSWGTQGSGDGQLNIPVDLATDSSNNVYAADFTNRRIVKYDTSGNYLLAWGTQGSGDGQFGSIRSIAIDSSNNIYVLEAARVQKFDASGTYLLKWGTSGTGNGQFSSVKGITTDAAGNVYTLDNTNRVQKFSNTGVFIQQWTVTTITGSNFLDLTSDESGNIYVDDWGARRIVVYSTTGSLLSTFGSQGNQLGQLNQATSIAYRSNKIYVSEDKNNRVQVFSDAGVALSIFAKSEANMSGIYGLSHDSLGNVYALTNGTQEVKKFSQTGLYLSKFGTYGTGSAEFKNAFSVSVASDNKIYVLDTATDRTNHVLVFNSSYDYLTSWGTQGTGDGQVNAPNGSVINENGVYIADTANNRIEQFDTSGNFIRKWGTTGSGDGQFSSPTSIGSDTSGNLYVTDGGNTRIQVFSPTGVFIRKWGTAGSGDGQFSFPYGLSVSKTGYVYVIDFLNKNVQKFDLLGTFQAKFLETGTGPGQLQSPVSITVTDQGYIYIGESDVSGARISYFFDPQAVVAEPTPTPTSAPPIGGGGTSTPDTSCKDRIPVNAPLLFQIKGYSNKATLYFVPVSSQNTGYFVSYGYDQKAEQFAVAFPHSDKSGAVEYTINNLTPNSRFYFKVKGLNGCASGEWSNTLSATVSRTQTTRPLITHYATQMPSSNSSCTVYTVRVGDSLSSIARRVLGNAQRYTTIRQQNSGTYPRLFNSTIILPGWKLLVCS